jgi:hypothetical protein
MFDFVRATVWRRSVVCFVGLILLAQWRAGAASLLLTGVSEGAQIVLPSAALFTNLSCAANVSGAGGSPEVAFTLERNGVVLSRLTSSAPYAVVFSNLSIGKYFLQGSVVTLTNLSSDVSFDIVAASQQPANDSFGLATAIPDLSFAVAATNTYATAEANEPVHGDSGAGRSVWWSWLASSSGIITATTEGSGFDTVLAVYTGTNVSALNLVAANDDAGFTNRSSQLNFSALAGTKYSFAVDGAMTTNGSAESGKVQLRLLAATPPLVALVAPTNGQNFLSTLALNTVAASASASSTAGVERVEFYLDGAAVSRSGVLLPPYQWSLTNLPSGDYLLTVSARDTLGLISSAHASFSIMSPAPRLVFVDAPVVPAGFQFAVTGLKGMNYELQGGTNLTAWSRLTLWTNFDGALRVADTNAAQFSSRYYRVISE